MAPASRTPEKSVYFFAAGESEGKADMKNILGGKGANLAEMTSLGIPVPPGFTISTEICKVYNDNGGDLPQSVRDDVLKALHRVEDKIGKKFGDSSNPLLVSVRSGARVSMPGMMDTILNLGLNDETVEGLAQISKNPRFAWDSYRRFIQMYSNVVLGVNHSFLEVTLEDLKADNGYTSDTELTENDLRLLVEKFKEQIFSETGKQFPTDPTDQLWGAVSAVFDSWNTARAKTYRELNNIPGDWGTAVNVQSMVFGNMGEDSATGVAFTRDPSTGEKKFYGEFLINAQGEDVVAGIRTPQPISRAAAGDSGAFSMEEAMPEVYGQLVDIYQKLELHYRDMQDLEFTVERQKLWMLQTRTGKRTAPAAIKIACDMIDEKLIDEKEALLRIDPLSLDQLLHPTLDPEAPRTLLTKGLPASPGGAVGQICFSSEDAAELASQGHKVILARVETSPEDIQGMAAAQGILTSRGGMTSHAAVVARGMGKCCVAGAGEIHIDYGKKEMRCGAYVLQEGEVITLDGSSGEVFIGELKTIDPQLGGDFNRIMKLADRYRTLGVRTNADAGTDADRARKFGAEGIGLCRTEHMFFGEERIDFVRKMIMAETRAEREEALAHLLPMQRNDFKELLEVMHGLPVTIRLLDPPLHEFVPQGEADMKAYAERVGMEFDKVYKRIENLHEQNPMLGHRGCRLAITYPEIYKMQVRAIAEAAAELTKSGQTLVPEIMIPLVGAQEELRRLRDDADAVVKLVQSEQDTKFDYLIGTMIELPRAAATADQIAEYADFFSFGTNDLTQTVFGLSRDDAGKFLGSYISEGIVENDPFVSIDQRGVGQFVKMGVDLGRRARPKLKLGICGEHGGDPQSIAFFQSVGLDYVSCSPFRVPIARLAAAQAAIRDTAAAAINSAH